MSDADDPWPQWSEKATKGDLIRAVVHMQTALTALAGALVSMRANNEEDAQARISTFFEASRNLSRVVTEIGGGKADG